MNRTHFLSWMLLHLQYLSGHLTNRTPSYAPRVSRLERLHVTVLFVLPLSWFSKRVIQRWSQSSIWEVPSTRPAPGNGTVCSGQRYSCPEMTTSECQPLIRTLRLCFCFWSLKSGHRISLGGQEGGGDILICSPLKLRFPWESRT